ncbi:capsule biosynthesis protein [Sphingomonas sp. BN140010]|uniref:Capsule biosynthesis protein n=1 Tax=Sphingomonas arvum TaxID=2992113 RepID=A0ABT3JC72_9SPHN|nr:capsule biosynthesis protein [Sphingomonas sp. BN140010]MCW3796671.1 capsule biosynthesis protein [Sphingomonas sp. BN140010]
MNANNFDHETVTEALRRSQRRSWWYRQRWMALFVGLPTVLAAIYYGLIASPVYVSHSSFVIKSPNQRPTPTLSLANIVQTSGLGMGSEQTKEILQYLRSRNALRDLQTRTNVRAAYSARGADFLSRFPRPFRGTTFEDLFRYYNAMVAAEIDNESNMAVLEVKAFTPEDAYAINGRLLGLSEALVNRLNQRAENRAITEAERRVLQAEERVRNARVALSAYRNQTSIIDPERQAQGVLEVSNRLITEQAALQAQLDLMVQVAPQNPAIPALRERIAAIGTAIEKQNSRAVGTPRAIASRLATFEKLKVEQEFATQMLTAANTSLEQARTESQKQQFYLERVVEPNRPDDPALPNGIKQVLTILGASLCLYFIGWMLVVGILEHSPED